MAQDLQNLPRISHPACFPFAIQIFQQRNGILAAHPGQFLKLPNVDGCWILLCKLPTAAAILPARRDEKTSSSETLTNTLSRKSNVKFSGPASYRSSALRIYLMQRRTFNPAEVNASSILFSIRLLILHHHAVTGQPHDHRFATSIFLSRTSRPQPPQRPR